MAIRTTARVVAALGAAVVLAGCTSTPTPTTTPTPTPQWDKPPVTVTTEPSVSSGGVFLTWTVTNNRSEDLWVVDYVSGIVPDADYTDGIVAAAVVFPPRTDVFYTRPPVASVVLLGPGASVKRQQRIGRPFEPFADRNGEVPVTLPGTPKSMRVCVGYVPRAAAPHVSQENSGGYGMRRDSGHALQTVTCSQPFTLP